MTSDMLWAAAALAREVQLMDDALNALSAPSTSLVTTGE